MRDKLSLPKTSTRRTLVSLDGIVGVADPRLFGSFVEHLGRGVYGGVYEPGDPASDARGFREDVIGLVRELGVTVVRYPGGNFVSGYDWRDGVGPVDDRPTRLDLAWKTIESNAFGTDEFIDWCRAADVEPMLAVNLGLGTVASALRLLEYTNHPGGTTLSDERICNGHTAPHDVRLWCLGNELDGPWQLGHRTAQEYGRLAAGAATALRMFDEDLELVAVGSSNADMPTFGEWEDTVLEHTVALVDYLSCHIYFYDGGDLEAFLRSSETLAGFLDEIAGRIAAAKERNPAARDVRISLDEWNVWDFRAYDDLKSGRVFERAPRILEQRYTVADAVVVGSLLQVILERADVVSIAALAQLVNVIGPIRVESNGVAWRQSIFHPFAAAARSAGHTVLRTTVIGDAAASATLTVSPAGDAARVLLSNRAVDTPVELEVELPAGMDRVIVAEGVWDEDPYAFNTAEEPERVSPRALPVEVDGGRLRVTLPPLSWAHVELGCGARPS